MASHNKHPAVIVIVFISVACIFFLAFLAVALFWFLKTRKKTVQETGIVRFDEHKKINEAVVGGPHGIETVALSVEDDIYLHGDVKKNEKVGEGLHAKSMEGNASTSGSHLHQLEHKA